MFSQTPYRMNGRIHRRLFSACLAIACGTATAQVAAALSSDDINRLCAGAEDNNDCGRRIEAAVLKSLPDGIVQRKDDTLIVQRAIKNTAKKSDDSIANAGGATISGTNIAVDATPGTPTTADNRAATGKDRAALRFTDKPDAVHDVSYTVWDYLPGPDAVILYVSENANAHFLWAARGSGKTVSLPAEPVLSPDKKQLATADFCLDGCTNELTVWALDGDVPAKRLNWSPAEAWNDAEVTWKSGNTLAVSYQKKGSDKTLGLMRTIDASDWRRVSADSR